MAERRHSKESKSPDSKKGKKAEDEEEHQKKKGLAGAARWVKKRATGQSKSSSVQPAQHEEMESTADDDTPHHSSQGQPPLLIEEKEEQHTGQWASWSSIATGGSSQQVTSGSTASPALHDSVLDDISTSEYQDKPSPDQYRRVASSAEGTSHYDRLNPAEMRRDVTVRQEPMKATYIPSSAPSLVTAVPDQTNVSQDSKRPILLPSKLIPSPTNRVSDNDILNQTETQVLENFPMQCTQPLPESPSQSEGINLAQELTKAELERDQYKTDIENKERQIQEYESDIVKLKAQLRSVSHQQQQLVMPDHLIEAQMEKNRAELAERDARIAQLDKKVKELEMKGDVAVNEACKEMQKEINELKLLLAQKERELTVFTGTAEKKGKDALLMKRLKDKVNELQTVKLQLERELTQARKEVEPINERTLESQTEIDELTGKVEELKKERKEKEEEIILQKARISHLTEKLRIQEAATGEAQGNADTERRENERLQREVEELKKEGAEPALQATRGIEKMEEEHRQQLEEKDEKFLLEVNAKDQQIRNLQEEMMTVRVELEKAQKLVQELDHNLGEEKSHTQAGLADEGASANNSLSEEEKEKRALETRIGELEEQVTKLETDKRAFQHQLTERETAVKEQDEKLQQMKQLLIQQATALNHEKDKLSQENDELKRKFTEATSTLETLQTVKGENEKNRELIQMMTQCNEKFVRDRQTCERQLYDAKKRLDDKCEELRKCELEKVRLRAELKNAIDERNQTVSQMRKQLEDQMTSAKEAKEAAVTEVFAKLQLKEQECAIYKMDFETERNDRQRIHQALTDQLDQVTGQYEELKQQLSEALKQSETDMQALADAENNTKQLTERKTKLELEIASFKAQQESLQSELAQVQDQLTNEQKQYQLWKDESVQLTEQIIKKKEKLQTENTKVTDQLDKAQQMIQQLNEAKTILQAEKASLMEKSTEEEDKLKTQKEEIQILTAQVNAYSRKGDELKRTLTQSQERYKTLESGKKTFETEVSELKTKLDSERSAKEQLVEQKNLMRQQLQSLRTSKEQLLTAFHEEQERVTSLKQEVFKLEDLYARTKSANQTLVQKLKVYEQSGSPQPQIRANNMSQAEAPPTSITIRRNDIATVQNLQAPITSTGGSYNQEQVVTAQSKGGAVYPTAANEPSDSVTEEDVPPVMNKEQMTQFFKIDQAEKDKERQLLEEQERQRLNQEADDALRDLDYAREHGIPASTATTDPVNQANFVSGQGEEKSHDDDTDSDNEVWPENKLIEGIDQEIQYYADQVRQMSRRPDTAEVELSDEDDSLPYDPNLVCPKCGKRYRIGGVQKFRRHVKELCTASS